MDLRIQLHAKAERAMPSPGREPSDVDRVGSLFGRAVWRPFQITLAHSRTNQMVAVWLKVLQAENGRQS